ncbi:MAG: alkaline phosphatase [Clostridia bacterium]|nr:alkaline phosphatase [Clostridia bacterium]
MNQKIIRRLIAVLLALSLLCGCASAVQAIVIPQNVKNVILLIGDGMGENSLEWTKQAKGVSLFVDTLPYQGYSKTDSLSGLTDSAAGATALSCGLRAFNSNLCECAASVYDRGVTFFTYLNVSEVAKSLGKRAGVVTSDLNTGATPAGFSAHTFRRSEDQEITDQQLAGDLDLIWAGASGLVTAERCAETGWQYADSLETLQTLPNGTRSFAALSGKIYYTDGAQGDAPLSTLTSLAIEQLDNDAGFFLMVEGAHIDKNSHSNDAEGMMRAVLEFDKAIENAVEFAKRDGNTIVIVTADHETGGITRDEATGEFAYTCGDHTRTDVPLRLFGSDALVKDGKHVKNTAVGRFIAKQLGYTERFPDAQFNFGFLGELIDALVQHAKEQTAVAA